MFSFAFKNMYSRYLSNDTISLNPGKVKYSNSKIVKDEIIAEGISNIFDITYENLLEEFILKDDLKNLLYEVYDLERLSGRVAFGNANARDLIQLRSSLKVLPDINCIISFLAPQCGHKANLQYAGFIS